MSIAWLIDGYNLLGALGLIQGKLGPAGLDRGRAYLLDLVARGLPADAGKTVVVFDARRKPRHLPQEQDYQGIEVRFAPGLADDLIEELIDAHALPRKLTVVSSDHRLQRAAHRRKARALDCHAFLDELEAHKSKQELTASTSDATPDRQTNDDTEFWRRTFADLDKQPGIDELFDDHGATDVDA